jgi:hypothetical protein
MPIIPPHVRRAAICHGCGALPWPHGCPRDLPGRLRRLSDRRPLRLPVRAVPRHLCARLRVVPDDRAFLPSLPLRPVPMCLCAFGWSRRVPGPRCLQEGGSYIRSGTLKPAESFGSFLFHGQRRVFHGPFHVMGSTFETSQLGPCFDSFCACASWLLICQGTRDAAEIDA